MVPRLNPENYTVAWIAPREIEARAAIHMLDRRHEGRFPVGRGDDYVFEAGHMCGYNIIIATLPAGQVYGTASAAALASQIKRFFPNLRFGLLVGVAAGLPSFAEESKRDIRLGDVLVALGQGESAGLIGYELGKETGDGFAILRGGWGLANTEVLIRSAIGGIKLHSPRESRFFLEHYNRMKHEEHMDGTFLDPGQDEDKLYDGDLEVHRDRRPDTRRTRVWYGSIGSGDKLIRNAQKRNELRDKYNLIGLEMEAAGTMNSIPVGVIRGVCNYGDEHKNKKWQPYAAAMAAAFAKAILEQIPPAMNSTMIPSSIPTSSALPQSLALPEGTYIISSTMKQSAVIELENEDKGGTLAAGDSNGWGYQKWRVIKLNEREYGFQSVYTNTWVIASSNGRDILTAEIDPADQGNRHARWTIRRTNPETYSYSVRSSMFPERCMDLKGGDTSNGTPIILWHYGGSSNRNQIWDFARVNEFEPAY